MNKLMKKLLTTLFIVSALFASGCTSTYQPIDYTHYYWPKEPLRTRLRLLTTIRTDLDIRQRTQAENIFGGDVYFSFTKPHAVVADPDGNIYVTDTYRRTVYMLNLEQESVKLLNKPGGWALPIALGIDNDNNLLAISDLNTVVLMNYKTHKVIRIFGAKEGFIRIGGLALDPANEYVYISDTRGSRIYKYDYNGNRLDILAEKGNGPTGVFFPAGLSVDSQGRLYVVDTMNWKIKMYGPDGKFIRDFGQHGSMLGQFNRPKDVSISKDGIVAVTDNDLNLFMLMNEYGQLYAYRGGSGGAPAQFHMPMGIFIDQRDRIYVVDQINRRLQIFQMYTDRYYEENPGTPIPAPSTLKSAIEELEAAQPTTTTEPTPEPEASPADVTGTQPTDEAEAPEGSQSPEAGDQ